MKNIGIFCGGFSSEYEISILSGQTIVANFPKEYNSYLIEVKKEDWSIHYNKQIYKLNPWNLSFFVGKKEIKLDAGLVYIHGNPGENGKLQAFFDLREFPYINAGALASELSFDKWFCNQFLKGFGISIAKSILLTAVEEYKEDEIIDYLSLPVFVKPCDSGSSYGISKVNKKSELKNAIITAFAEGKTVVIESFLKGKEITCGVYRNEKGVITLPLTEIVSDNEFFDYEAKYKGKSNEITPAPISVKHEDRIKEKAILIYKILQIKSIARIDFMLVEDEPYLIEVNTTPGFSPASIVPQMIKADGNTIENFWREIIETEIKI
ncbi:MAG: D-alanine--D-alanine ligase [Flavobacteriia bacterium]|nr:D-alanine--D-alanine ligase [Flavobacteriia bacterium]